MSSLPLPPPRRASILPAPSPSPLPSAETVPAGAVARAPAPAPRVAPRAAGRGGTFDRPRVRNAPASPAQSPETGICFGPFRLFWFFRDAPWPTSRISARPACRSPSRQATPRGLLRAHAAATKWATLSKSPTLGTRRCVGSCHCRVGGVNPGQLLARGPAPTLGWERGERGERGWRGRRELPCRLLRESSGLGSHAGVGCASRRMGG